MKIAIGSDHAGFELKEEIRKYLEDKGYEFLEAETMMIPNDKVTLSDDQLETFRKMLDAFDDQDDVQDVYHNVDLPEEDEED